MHNDCRAPSLLRAALLYLIRCPLLHRCVRFARCTLTNASFILHPMYPILPTVDSLDAFLRPTWWAPHFVTLAALVPAFAPSL